MSSAIRVEYPAAEGRVSEEHLNILKSFEAVLKCDLINITGFSGTYSWSLDESLQTDDYFELVKMPDKVLAKFGFRTLKRLDPEEFIFQLRADVILPPRS